MSERLYVKDVPRTQSLVRNLVRIAERSDLEEGRMWYARARRFCKKMARRYGLDVETVARVVAVLSPAVSWEVQLNGQVESVIRAYVHGRRAPRVAGYRRNTLKAYRVLRGDHDACRGPKVESFALNILGCGDSVTVDRHAARAACGLRNGGDLRFEKGAYTRIARAYRIAAERLGCEPCVLQAAVWVQRKREARSALKSAGLL